MTTIYEQISRGRNMLFSSLLLRIGVFIGIHAGLLVGFLTVF